MIQANLRYTEFIILFTQTNSKRSTITGLVICHNNNSLIQMEALVEDFYVSVICFYEIFSLLFFLQIRSTSPSRFTAIFRNRNQ